MTDQQQEDLRPYRMFGLTMLQLMSLLAVLGVVSTILLKWWFN